MDYESIQRLFVLSSFLFLFLLVKNVMLKYKTGNYKFCEKAEKNGWKVHANLVYNSDKIYYHDDGSSNGRGIYEYFIGGKCYRKKLKFSFDTSSSCYIPSTMTLYYNPKRPSKAYAKNSDNQQHGCIISIILYFLYLSVGIYIIDILFR